MTRLFLDTEWADTLGSELVSLALVDEGGQHRFYAEVNPLPDKPMDFVRNVVYPLFERGEHAMSGEMIAVKLRCFLSQFDTPCVIYDYHVDGALFRYALSGFESNSDLGPCPDVIQTLTCRGDVRHLIERYFREHPELNPRRHHALVDAEALRWAFMEAVRTGSR